MNILASKEQAEEIKDRAHKLPHGSIKNSLLEHVPYSYGHLTRLLNKNRNMTRAAYFVLDIALKKIEIKI